MNSDSNFCRFCGNQILPSSQFCSSCGKDIGNAQSASAIESGKNPGLFQRYWKKSVRSRIFYGLWVLINFSNVVSFISAATAPTDRFRSICNWEGINCAPSPEEKMTQAILNLIVWNLVFWLTRYFYRKRHKSKL